ncbi:dimethylsulfonioproprionate lyase family protein [Dyadobacter tibetensis]|uniref:dimethylsulfonioproprionate lyase family protein n=1 Tax=Dyadobacter tibetensis TaxID=1211851 RepID=UPI00046EEC70|nr:cupin domain-containing protein [Dyadobacter tibetensis]
MKTEIKEFIVDTYQKEWQPLVEKGINYDGIFVKSLLYDDKKGRSTTILLKFEPGAVYPYHNHPGGEEIYVIEGSCTLEGARLDSGNYLYTPPNFKHSVTSKNGCILLFIIPEEVEIL